MPSSYPPRPIHILDHVYKVIPDRQGYNDKLTCGLVISGEVWCGLLEFGGGWWVLVESGQVLWGLVESGGFW